MAVDVIWKKLLFLLVGVGDQDVAVKKQNKTKGVKKKERVSVGPQ